MSVFSCCCDWGFEIIQQTTPPQVVYSTQSTTPISGSGSFYTVRYQYDDLTAVLSGISAKMCVGSDDEDSLYIVSGQQVYKYSSQNVLVWTYNSASSSWPHQWLAVNASKEVWASQVNGTTLRLVKINSSGSGVWATDHTGLGAGSTLDKVGVDLSGNSVAVGLNRRNVTDNEGALLYHNSSGTLQWTVLASSLVDYTAPSPQVLRSRFCRPIFDASGNVYCGLQLLTETTDGFVTQSVQHDTLFKFDSTGATVWAKPIGVQVVDICLDADGNLYVAYDNEDHAAGDDEVRLTRLSGASHNTVDWDVELLNVNTNSRMVLAVNEYVYTYHPRLNTLTSERIDKSNGSVLESVDLVGASGNFGLCASPGMVPHFQ